MDLNLTAEVETTHRITYKTATGVVVGMFDIKETPEGSFVGISTISTIPESVRQMIAGPGEPFIDALPDGVSVPERVNIPEGWRDADGFLTPALLARGYQMMEHLVIAKDWRVYVPDPDRLHRDFKTPENAIHFAENVHKSRSEPSRKVEPAQDKKLCPECGEPMVHCDRDDCEEVGCPDCTSMEACNDCNTWTCENCQVACGGCCNCGLPMPNSADDNEPQPQPEPEPRCRLHRPGS